MCVLRGTEYGIMVPGGGSLSDSSGASQVKVDPTSLSPVVVLEPQRFPDDRGFLTESFNKRDFAEAIGSDAEFVQDNHSHSVRGVLRGLHYQLPPSEQDKLVQCVHGEVFDVAVDIRRSSATFGQWVATRLSGSEGKYLWIPMGFAHGFVVLSDTADVIYKVTGYYAPQSERTLRWDDPMIGIKWPDIGTDPILSARDRAAPFLSEAEVFD